jgi:HlyD family secretion protein
MLLKQKKYIIPAVILAVVAITYFVVFQVKPNNEKFFKIKKGNLEVVVNCQGELNGEKYTEISLPAVLCNQELRVYQYKIADAIQEGKVVKKGDYIAKLDESQLSNMVRDIMLQKEKLDADLRNEVLDSAVSLSRRREEINNARLDLEYLEIDLEQSKFESEAYQRKTQMRYQKAQIAIEKIKRDYLLSQNRQKMIVGRYKARVDEYQKRIENYQAALAATTVTAPEDGIVMFAKDRNSGKPYGKDSDINIWRPMIATLPDMSVVITESYIREIDISKIELGDSVRIRIDALPERAFHGQVIKIANIGEDHKDFDMKVFKIIIRFEKSDMEMKPGMTANNDVIISSYRDELLVPLKAVFSKNGQSVVYLKNGGVITEQKVDLVAENGTFGVVENTLKAGDIVLMFQPEEFNAATEPLVSRE